MLKCRKIAMESCWQRDMTAHHSALYTYISYTYIITYMYIYISYIYFFIFFKLPYSTSNFFQQPFGLRNHSPVPPSCQGTKSAAACVRVPSPGRKVNQPPASNDDGAMNSIALLWRWISHDIAPPADREDHNFDHLSTCNILVNTSHMVERIVPVENGACCMLGCVLPRISKGILKTLMSASKVQRLFCRLFYRISPKAAQFHALLALLGRRMS